MISQNVRIINFNSRTMDTTMTLIRTISNRLKFCFMFRLFFSVESINFIIIVYSDAFSCFFWSLFETVIKLWVLLKNRDCCLAELFFLRNCTIFVSIYMRMQCTRAFIWAQKAVCDEWSWKINFKYASITNFVQCTTTISQCILFTSLRLTNWKPF